MQTLLAGHQEPQPQLLELVNAGMEAFNAGVQGSIILFNLTLFFILMKQKIILLFQDLSFRLRLLLFILFCRHDHQRPFKN